MSKKLISAEAFAEAERHLTAHLPEGVRELERFRNSLELFISNFNDSSIAPLKRRIYAVDTTELVAAFAPHSNDEHNFKFASLLAETNVGASGAVEPAGGPNISTDLENLDKLISHQLIKSGTHRVLLLDAFVKETTRRANAFAEQAQNLVRNSNPKIHLELSVEQLERIESLILKQGDHFATEKEWNLFRSTFLPRWRTGLLSRLAQSANFTADMRSYIRSGRNMYIRSSEFFKKIGENVSQTIENHIVSELSISEFSFEELEAYFDKRSIREQSADLRDQLYSLLDRRRPLSSGARDSNIIDADAIVQTHFANMFFIENRLPIEVDIVSRAPSLLDLMASLPRHAVRVSVRHPMFIPEIYQFQPNVLRSISELFSDITSTLGILQSIESVTGAEELREARRQAKSVVSYLGDITIAAQTAAQDAETIDGTVQSILRTSAPDPRLTDVVIGVFRALKESVERGNDRLLKGAWRDTSGALKTIVSKGLPEEIKLRYMIVDQPGSISPIKFTAIRLINPYFGPIFHIYSEHVADMLIDWKEMKASSDLPNIASLRPESVVRSTLTILDKVDEYYDLERGYFDPVNDEQREDVANGLSSALVAALVFAGSGMFEAATNLLVAVLRPVMKEIRTNSLALEREKENIPALLAIRELFLLRHHCERLLALERFQHPLRVGPVEDSSYLPRNFARSQRDLDLAVLMSEKVEACLAARKDGERTAEWMQVSPAGSYKIDDGRQLITHVGGWLDQFVVFASSRYQSWDVPLLPRSTELEMRRRMDMWIMAGFAKELTIAAFWMRRRHAHVSRARESSALRYMVHLEARQLQSALMLFVVGVTFHIVPDMHLFLQSGRDPGTDRQLVFRDWKNWWDRYLFLRKKYGFEFRMNHLIDAVCRTVEGIKSGKSVSDQLSSLVAQLEEICKDHHSRSFMVILAEALMRRLGGREGTELPAPRLPMQEQS